MKKGKQMRAYRFSSEHVETRSKWLNTAQIYSFLNIQYPNTIDQTREWYERIRNNSSRIDFVFSDDESHLSMTGLTNIDLNNGLAEFYIMVNPERLGNGYGKKTTEWTLNYAFINYNINKVYLYTNDFNDIANAMYHKLGFSLEGQLRKHKYRDGKFIDRYVYGLLKEEWESTYYYVNQPNLEF